MLSAAIASPTRTTALLEPLPPGQQTGIKRLKSPSLNHAKSNRETPETHMDRAIPRQSSSTVVTPVATCHAGRPAFASRCSCSPAESPEGLHRQRLIAVISRRHRLLRAMPHGGSCSVDPLSRQKGSTSVSGSPSSFKLPVFRPIAVEQVWNRAGATRRKGSGRGRKTA
jgi:hypothetical protein